MQPEEMSFQSMFEGDQSLGRSDIHRKIIPPLLGPEQTAVLTKKCRCDRCGSGAERSGMCVGVGLVFGCKLGLIP